MVKAVGPVHTRLGNLELWALEECWIPQVGTAVLPVTSSSCQGSSYRERAPSGLFYLRLRETDHDRHFPSLGCNFPWKVPGVPPSGTAAFCPGLPPRGCVRSSAVFKVRFLTDSSLLLQGVSEFISVNLTPTEEKNKHGCGGHWLGNTLNWGKNTHVTPNLCPFIHPNVYTPKLRLPRMVREAFRGKG